ncbi:MAG: 23S rRNA (guanosine(2251)-2'-O)-methyltransferase RlmB, partial [Pseudomonadales bacterium]|nr:23S rRNA (guanosine(2251)-2'-O)-methyltransferase RlmB [Pseudomonadales bacterium]
MANDSVTYVYGINSVRELIEHRAAHVDKIVLNAHSDNPRLRELRERARKLAVIEEALDAANFANALQAAGLETGHRHQDVFACCKPSEVKDEAFLLALLRKAREPALLLLLDGVTDPHNLGACLRSANAAGVQAVVVPQDKSAGMTPVVRKVASGAAEITPLVVVKNLARSIQALQREGVWVMGAAGDAGDQTLYDLDLAGPLAIVMGSEGSGLRRLTRERC